MAHDGQKSFARLLHEQLLLGAAHGCPARTAQKDSETTHAHIAKAQGALLACTCCVQRIEAAPS